MNTHVVLAYGGSADDTAAVLWLVERHAAQVTTVTLDLGQEGSRPGHDLDELRARALGCGAQRAHVLDVRDEFARECVLPWLRGGRLDDAGLGALARPLIARKLAEVARIEGAAAAAHGGAGDDLDRALALADPALPVLAPTRERAAAGIDAATYTRQRGVFVPASAGAEAHLLQRRLAAPGRAGEIAATVEITFGEGVPLAVNGVPLTVTELIESLSVIAGEHRVGRIGGLDAPAAVVLDAAYRALGDESGTVRLRLFNGAHEVVDPATAPHRASVRGGGPATARAGELVDA